MLKKQQPLVQLILSVSSLVLFTKLMLHDFFVLFFCCYYQGYSLLVISFLAFCLFNFDTSASARDGEETFFFVEFKTNQQGPPK